MRILLVEDDENKLRELSMVLEDSGVCSALRVSRSFIGALDAIAKDLPDLIVLDMSLPNYDLYGAERGGRRRTFGGRDLMRELLRAGTTTNVLVVTQFEEFGEGRDVVSAKTLAATLTRVYPQIFKGMVYYHPARADWQRKILDVVRSLDRGRQ